MTSDAAGYVQHAAAGRHTVLVKELRQNSDLGLGPVLRLLQERQEQLRPFHEQPVGPVRCIRRFSHCAPPPDNKKTRPTLGTSLHIPAVPPWFLDTALDCRAGALMCPNPLGSDRPR